MRSLLVCVLLILAVQAHRKNKSHDSKDKNEVEVGQPTSCALYMDVPIPLDEEAYGGSDDISSKKSSDDYQGTTFYDPGQFLANGGSFEMPQSSSIYYFYFCSDLPIAVEEVVNCDSDSSICAVDSTTEVATSMATFADMSYAPKDNYQEGLTINFTHVDVNTKAECVYSFVLNCTKNFDTEKNYTVTLVEPGTQCGATIYMNTVAGCPITAERKEIPVHRPTFTRFFLLGFAVLGGVIFLCSCCLACCLCCKNRRAKCAAKRAACSKPILPQQRPAAAPVAAPRPAPVAAPRPPVTPPPQQQQQMQQMPQMPGYFVPVPQGMAPMYPNLYQGGYLPLVPMMQQQPAVQQLNSQNPFVALSDNQVEQRDHQIAEDERLARLLQQQFNNSA